jgi:hypothetical protein
MFSTDYLKEYDAKDWVCIVDFCGRHSTIGRNVDYCAWYSPSLRRVAFGNNWGDVPDMPRNRTPTEGEVYQWVRDNPGFLQKMIKGELERSKKQKKEFKESADFIETYGCGKVYVKYVSPSGKTIKEIEHSCGIYGPLYMLGLATEWMVKNLEKGTVLKKLTVSRRKPFYKGEKEN